MNKRVLCVLAPGFEEIEAVTPIDLLRRAGVAVTVAALTAPRLVRGRNGVSIEADSLLEETNAEDFDLRLLPGGPGVEVMRKDGRAADLARRFAAAGKVVAAICAAPTVLHDAGLLEGRRFTAHFSVDLPGALRDEPVVRDGRIVTSRGAGTAMAFGLELVAELAGREKAGEIASAIML